MSDEHDIASVVCRSETAKALLCVVDGKSVWIPKSVISEDSEVYQAGDEGALIIKQWFAEKEGIG